MAFKMKGHSLPGPHQRKTTDMSILRSKQARARKGISEFEHFKDPKSQGDEPIVEGTWGGKSPTKHFEGLVHDHPHASGKKKTSKAMKRKIAEVKDANLKETNKILVSQGKDPVEAAPDSPATSKSPAKIAPLVLMGAQMLGKKMMEKKQEKDSPATQTKFPNSPGANRRKKKKFTKKFTKSLKKPKALKMYTDATITGASEGLSEAIGQLAANKARKQVPNIKLMNKTGDAEAASEAASQLAINKLKKK